MLIQYDLILSNYICKDPVFQEGHNLNYQVDINLEGDSIQPCAGGKINLEVAL